MFKLLRHLVFFFGSLLLFSIFLFPIFQQTNRAEARLPTAADEPVLEPLPFASRGQVSFFGGAVAMDGETMVIGATGTEVSPEDDRTQLLGAAYVYTFGETDEGMGWTQQAKLIPEDFEEFGELRAFGESVAISGDTIVIGASRNRLDGLRGAVYVFTGSGSEWTLQTRLGLSDATDELLAGETVAISGDTIAVGIPDTTGGQNNISGVVHLFERTGTTWSLTTTLSITDGDPDRHDQFGFSVSLDQNRLVVGDKHGASGFPTTRGALYLYTKEQNGWQFEAKLDNPRDEPAGEMGNAVALEGDVIVAGAEGEENGDNILQGAIHIFVRRRISEDIYEWRHAYRFTAPDGAELDNFGHAVSIKNGLIVVGADQADVEGIENRGAAYVFAPVAGAWVNVLKLTADDSEEDDVLGSAVTNNGEWVAIGAPHLEQNSTGRAYVIQVSEFPEGKALFLPFMQQ